MKYLIGLSCLFFLSCGNESIDSHLKPLNLMKHGIPLTIMAPESSTVQTLDLVVQKDVSIKNGEDFYIQLFMSDATEVNLVKVVSKLKKDVQKGTYFSKFIKEEESGFIFENSLDSLHQSYDFRHVKIQGDKEYEFRTGLVGSFTLEEAELMYQAVQSK